MIHPKTGVACVVPEKGWRFPKKETMEQKIKDGLVEFREDHTEPPFRKSHLRPISNQVSTEDEEVETEGANGEDEFATMVRGTYFYRQSLVSTKHLENLLGSKIFDNPKDHFELARLFKYVCDNTKHPLVMDFFGGSGSSAEAVLTLAASTIPDMRFVTVQLPEPCNPKDQTGKAALAAGFNTIADIARTRICKVIEKMEVEKPGLRVFKLTESAMKRWNGVESTDPDTYQKQLEAFTDSLAPGWKPEDVVWEVALREGYTLTSKIEKIESKSNLNCWSVSEEGRNFKICLDDNITMKALSSLKLSKEDIFICRDIALDDTLAANLALQCRLKVF